jgi:hypothetical protein
MPRPILGSPQARTAGSAAPVHATKNALTGPQLQQRLRTKRSAGYVKALAKLDVGGYHADRASLDALIEAIAAEFPELGIEQRPLGLVSQCSLGAPYEVHICDLAGSIVEHFETFRRMPPLFERARALALHPEYCFIEIYADSLRAIGADGSVSVI